MSSASIKTSSDSAEIADVTCEINISDLDIANRFFTVTLVREFAQLSAHSGAGKWCTENPHWLAHQYTVKKQESSPPIFNLSTPEYRPVMKSVIILDLIMFCVDNLSVSPTLDIPRCAWIVEPR